MPNMLRLHPSDRLLYFAPHPDDETLAGGGLIQKAAAIGAQLCRRCGERRGSGQRAGGEGGDAGAEEVRDRVLQAAEYIPVEQLGTTDDCGFSPFSDDTSTSRDTAFAKIRSRVLGTQLAADRIAG